MSGTVARSLGNLADTLGTTATANVNIDNGVLFVDGVNNRVGIGTSSPTSPLTVSGDLAFNSGFGSASIGYGCRAWVNFSLPGSASASVRASGGVSSVVQNGTGDCTVNFSFTMPDANYIVVGGGMDNGTAYFVMPWIISQSTTSIRLQPGRFAAGISLANIVHLAFFR